MHCAAAAAAAAPQKRCHRRHVVIQNYKKL